MGGCNLVLWVVFLCNRVEIYHKPQSTKPLHIVNLSEGSSPKPLNMNRKPYGANPMQVVNLSEGCISAGKAHNLCKL